MADDGCFRLEAVNCLGQCERCPAVRIDDLVFGKVTASEVSELLRLVRADGQSDLAELRQRAGQDDELPETRPGEHRRLLGAVTPTVRRQPSGKRPTEARPCCN